MRVYVAGSSRELDRAHRTMDLVRAAGHEVTHDWVAKVREYGHAHPADTLNRTRCALKDMQGVMRADVVLVLMPEDHTSPGAHVELGYALGAGKTVITSGPKTSIFGALCLEVPSDLQAIAALGSIGD